MRIVTPMATTKVPRPLDFSIFDAGAGATPEERTTHEASCQCGAVQFNIALKWPFPKYPVNTCTCSICVRNGYLFVYPARKDVVFTSGEDNMSEFYFATKTMPHKFCKTCGTSILVDFKNAHNNRESKDDDPNKDVLGVTIRTLKDIDLDNLEYTIFDGKNRL